MLWVAFCVAGRRVIYFGAILETGCDSSECAVSNTKSLTVLYALVYINYIVVYIGLNAERLLGLDPQ